jgi:hypothetical protein
MVLILEQDLELASGFGEALKYFDSLKGQDINVFTKYEDLFHAVKSGEISDIKLLLINTDLEDGRGRGEFAYDLLKESGISTQLVIGIGDTVQEYLERYGHIQFPQPFSIEKLQVFVDGYFEKDSEVKVDSKDSFN